MKPELIIHIGYPKTGTSSLQWAFENNRELLSAEGIFYPVDSSGNRHGRGIYRLIDREFKAEMLGNEKKSQKDLTIETERYAHFSMGQLIDGGYKKMLISEEMLAGHVHSQNIPLNVASGAKITDQQIEKYYIESVRYRAVRLKSLYDKCSIKIVCYLRRQDLFLESFYNQDVKQTRIKERISRFFQLKNAPVHCENEYGLGIPGKDEFFNLYVQYRHIVTYYYKMLGIWASVFGKENIIVDPFEKSQFKEGLVKDFFIDVLNIAPDKLASLKEKHVNERISRDVLEYVNALKERPKYCKGNALTEISQKLGDVNRYQEYFTREERLRLLEHHREGNEKIAREYLGREDGKLFYEEVDMTEPEPYPGLTPEKIAILDEEFRRAKDEFERVQRQRNSLTYRFKRVVKRAIKKLMHICK